MLFTIKRQFLKISLYLQATLASAARPPGGELRKKRRNVEKLSTFQAGTRIQTGSRSEGQHLVSL
jgi:hypothetical protein